MQTCDALLLGCKHICERLAVIETAFRYFESEYYDDISVAKKPEFRTYLDDKCVYVVDMRLPTKDWPERNKFEELATEENELLAALDVLQNLIIEHYEGMYE